MSMSSPNDTSDPIIISDITGLPILRPSNGWLRRPAYMDGHFDPPRLYHTVEIIEEAAAIWGAITGIQREDQPVPNPVPVQNQVTTGATTTNQTDSPLERAYLLDQAMARISPTPVPMMQQGPNIVNLPDEPPLAEGGDGDAIDDGGKGDYTIRATVYYPPAFVPGAKQSKKPQPLIKVFNIRLKNVTRYQLIEAILDAHGLIQSFAPGVVSGPPIKIYWSGSIGGKSGAASIKTDAEYANNTRALFAKRTKPAEVCIELISSELEPFRIQDKATQALANPGTFDDAQELMFGTNIPSVSTMSTSAQLHAEHVLELKRHWKCSEHPGEHGEPGCCYQPTGVDREHIRLNPYRLKIWAAAWVAGDCGKLHPPAHDAFNGIIRGTMSAVKPRGLVGSRPATLDQPPTPSNANDLVAMVLAMMLPTLAESASSRKRIRSPSQSPAFRSRRFHTPTRTPTSRIRNPIPPPVYTSNDVIADASPHINDIEGCLTELAAEGTDFTSYASSLSELDLTPDVIPDADDALLIDLLGGSSVATVGKILKLKQFCRRWVVRCGKQRDVFSV